jgi:hypothetical protein
MPQASVERRRGGRRVSLEAPLRIGRLLPDGPEPFSERLTKNVSLAGFYFELSDHHATPYAVDEVVLTSVSIPEPERRRFPFTRLAGRGRVVRVIQLPPQSADGARRVGVGIEFGADLLALTTTPPRG